MWISTLPKFRPSSIPMKAVGACASPSVISSRYLIFPLLIPADTISKNAG